MTSKAAQIRPRLRIILGGEIAMGPGKFELLQMIERTGSISAASAKLEMSYMRAWTLIRTMNRCFREPLVIAARGGSKGGGGAQLTEAGRQAVVMYERMNAKSLAAVQPEWAKMKKLLRK